MFPKKSKPEFSVFWKIPVVFFHLPKGTGATPRPRHGRSLVRYGIPFPPQDRGSYFLWFGSSVQLPTA